MSVFWYALWCAQSAEMKVADTLQAMNYDVYLPVEIRWSRHGVGKDRQPTKKLQRPLVPRYVFVQMQQGDDDSRAHVRGVEGVERILGRLDAPGADALYELKTMQALGTWDETLKPLKPPRPVYLVGDEVRLTEGHYAGWEGRIDRLQNGEKAKVELFNRVLGKWQKPIVISLDDLEAA